VGAIASSQSTASVTSRTSVEVSRAVARVSDLGAAQNLVVMVDQIFATSRHLSGVGCAGHAAGEPGVAAQS